MRLRYSISDDIPSLKIGAHFFPSWVIDVENCYNCELYLKIPFKHRVKAYQNFVVFWSFLRALPKGNLSLETSQSCALVSHLGYVMLKTIDE